MSTKTKKPASGEASGQATPSLAAAIDGVKMGHRLGPGLLLATLLAAAPFGLAVPRRERQTKDTLHAALFGLERSGDPLDLELPHVWGILSPLGNGGRSELQRGCQTADALEVRLSLFCFHAGMLAR
jgi:hypothetical protein